MPFLTALGAVAKHIERGPAQAFQAGEQFQHRAEPGAVAGFLQMPLHVALGEQRGREVVLHFEVAFEGVAQARLESSIGMQACDFVFVFVGHQLVEIARHQH